MLPTFWPAHAIFLFLPAMPFLTTLAAFALVAPIEDLLGWKRSREDGAHQDGAFDNHKPTAFGQRPGTWVILSLVPIGTLYLLDYSIQLREFPSRLLNGEPTIARHEDPDTNSSPILAELRREIGLKPGGLFRGSVGAYYGSSLGPLREVLGISPEAQHAGVFIKRWLYLLNSYGNNHSEVNLWSLDLPTVEEYAQMISPYLLAYFAQFLTPPGQNLSVARLEIMKPHVNVLRAMGVRFLITDATLADTQLSLRQTYAEGGAVALKLYEIADPNLGTYSPTRIIRIPKAKDVFARMKSPAFSFEEEVIVQEPVSPGPPLVKASRSRLFYEPNAVRVEADSPGRSILLLPVQFSRCWKAEGLDGGPPPEEVQVMRGDLLHTAVVFEKKLRLRLQWNFGILGKAACRAKDNAELRALDRSFFELLNSIPRPVTP